MNPTLNPITPRNYPRPSDEGTAQERYSNTGIQPLRQCVPTPPPQTIGSIISDTNAFLDGLTENIGLLESSLAPILRQDKPADKEPSPTPLSGESQLTDALLTINRRIGNLSSMVRSITERNTL